MLRHSSAAAAPARGPLRTTFRAGLYVLVCTGVSIVSIACQSAPEPEETGPVSVVAEEAGLVFAALPAGCTAVEASDLPMELACELVETTESPAGPAGSIWLELGDPSEFGIEIDDVARGHREFFVEMPGGEFFGGRQIIGPLGPARYTRGRFQDDMGAAWEQIRLFMLHPLENRLVTIVSQHPAGEDEDTSARINNHLLMLLTEMDLADAAPAAEDGAEDPA